jgi:hypothetical protein
MPDCRLQRLHEPRPGDGSDAAPAEVPDDPEQPGYQDGFDAGCQAAFDAAGTDTLNEDGQSFTIAGCTAQG